MRALIVAPKIYGPPWHDGVKNIVRRLTKDLRDRGDEVMIVSIGRAESAPNIGEFGEEIFYSIPVEDRQAKDRRLWKRLLLWWAMINLVRNILRKKDPDVCLLLASGSLFLGPRAFIFRRLLGRRLVIYVSGLNRPAFGINWFLGNTKIIVGSPFLLRWFPQAIVAYPLLPTHLEAIEPSIDARDKSDNKPFSILYLGTSQRERGVEYLLNGVALALKRTHRSLKLTLALNSVGNENDRRINQLIIDFGLTDIVTVLGVVDTDKAYRDADVVVIPRQSPIRMSFPLRIIESLRYHKPLIVTSVCEMGNLIEGCGLVVNSKDPNELAQAIVDLSDDSNKYDRLSNNCPTLIQKYESRQSLEIIYSELKSAAEGS